VCVWVDNELNFAYHVGNSTTEPSVQGDNMSNLKNKLFNDKYQQELNKHNQDEIDYYTDFESLEVDMENQHDELLDLSDDNCDDHVNIQAWCQDLEAIESLDSLDDNFNYMEI
tara:strand:+ start:397 stop:735 length:339 start_codon:yes stop_codon:yes gene_type:complete